jgi:hypothetical protein
VARIHGDEFVILIPVFSGELQLNRIRGKLETLFERPFKVGFRGSALYIFLRIA